MPIEKKSTLKRRQFVSRSAAVAAGAGVFQIVPRNVIGQGQVPPSEQFGAALIGAGSRGGGTFKELSSRHKLSIRKLAVCDVDKKRLEGKVNGYRREEPSCTGYQDFRRVLERKDIDVVAIATPPHWHALISIMAMQAGKDVVCEKPMTRFVGEGRAVINAAKRYKKVFQIGTYGRFGHSGRESSMMTRKIMLAGFGKGRQVRYVHGGGFKVKMWSGIIEPPQPVPEHLDWDMYCGPSPLKPFHPRRHGGTHRGYWDYENGGLGDMGQHKMDPITYLFGRDNQLPIKVEASAPPAHPEVCGVWGWSKLTYADGFEMVLESGEWGERSGLKTAGIKYDDLTKEEQEKLDALPDPEPLVGFGEAVKTRKQAGGNAEAAHYTVCVMHLTNLAIRTGRTIHIDPVKEVAINDDEANRLINQPYRAPWHL
jgi:predicted dehydrogenase